MLRLLPAKAATILSSAVMAAALTASAAFATTPSMPPPPPEAGTPPAAPQMQPSALDQFRETLAGFGSFHSHPFYGEVWKPSEQVAPPGWSPYPVCHWQFDREQRAWNFADPTPWGAIVHHHGRWANDPQFGWIWVADANSGPGWVFWRTEGQAVSWAPLLPEQHGNQPPRDGWQSQDLASLQSGCRQSAPPAPSAGYRALPDPGPRPMMAMGSGPAYVPGGPVFIPGGPVFIPGRHRPHICHTGIRPSWCRPHRHPHHPGHVHRPHRPHHIGHVHRPFRPHVLGHRPMQHRPFAGQFRPGPRFAMGGHRSFGHRGFGRR